MKYYELFTDMEIPRRWVLANPVDEHGQEIDPWQFEAGRPIELRGEPRLLLAHRGSALDFSLTTLGVPVVHGRVKALLEHLGVASQVQFFSAQVEGQAEPFFILNTLHVIRCIDEGRCEEVRYWMPEDDAPDRLGDYRLVRGLRIDPRKVGDAHIFRTQGWRGALIVSAYLKQALEEAQVSGTEFTEV